MNRCFLISAIALSAVGTAVDGAELRVERVAPASAIGVLQFIEADRTVATMQMHGVLLDSDDEELGDFIRTQLESLPVGLSSAWESLIDERGPISVLSDLSGGLVAWVERSEREAGQLTLAGWVDLGDDFNDQGDLLDAAWAGIRESPDVTTETVLGREVDRIAQSREPTADTPMPRTVWHVREDRYVLVSNTRAGLERLLDALDGTELDTTLEETDAWSSLHGMLGAPQSVLVAVFMKPAFDAASLFDPMGVSKMVEASFDAAIGPVRAIAIAGGAGEASVGDAIIKWSGALWMPDGQGGLLRLLSGDTPRSSLPSWVGPDVVAVSRVNVSFKRIPDWLRSVAASNPMLMGVSQMLDQMEPTMRAMLEPLGRQLWSIETLSRPIAADSLQSVQTVECSNPQALADAIASSAPKANMEPREFQGHQIWSLDLGEVMPLPLPGQSDRVSVAVAGGSLLIGSDAAVESALRGLSSRGGNSPPWVARVLEWMPAGSVAAWGGWDLPETMTAVAEIDRLRARKWEDEIRADDPELWEEIKGELIDEDRSAQLERLAKIAAVLGPAAWWVKSGSEGFWARGVVFGAEAGDQ